MQIKPPSSFCAGAAIAALALGTTALAQEVAPAPDIPTVAPAAPAVSSPPSAPAPQVITRSDPVVQQVPVAPPVAAEPAPAGQTGTAAPAKPTPRTAARTPSVVAAPAAAAPAAPATIAPAPLPAVAPVAPPAPIAATRPAPPADDGLTGAEAGLLALLAAAGLAGAGFLAFRSSRRSRGEAEEIATAPIVTTAAVPTPAPEAIVARPTERPVFAPERIAMPAAPAPAGDARKALLERMVAAPPDADNPFVSRKRRVRRARMLLAQREEAQTTRAGEPFDWRTYRSTGANASIRENEPSMG